VPLGGEEGAFEDEDHHLAGSVCRRDGKFLVQVPPGKYVVRASAEGFGAGDSEVLEVGGGERREGVVIEIAPVGRVAGRVVKASGEAVPDAEISHEESPGTRAVKVDAADHHWGPLDVGISTDADGRFVLDLGEGSYDLSASHESEGEGKASRVAVRSGETTEATIVLEPR
jgi:hypothetical protein